MHPRCCRTPAGNIVGGALYHTQSSAPEDGQNNCQKHVELIGIINKSLLLHIVGCLYYLYFIIFFWDLLNNLNLTHILKTWRIWWAPNNACKWQTDLIRRLNVNTLLLSKPRFHKWRLRSRSPNSKVAPANLFSSTFGDCPEHLVLYSVMPSAKEYKSWSSSLSDISSCH